MWWQETVIYEVYVRSFCDSDGDGVGDLPGVLERLDYLAELGVEAVWLTPIHSSPDADVGYDVADYVAVDERLGTLADVGGLLRAAHARGMRVLLDLVVNHTSVAHPWFAASRASREDPRRDWYIWRAGPPGAPPTNWRSLAGGSAWQYDAATGEHYLHTFLPEQPDLTWRNADVRAAVADVMRFWLERGGSTSSGSTRCRCWSRTRSSETTRPIRAGARGSLTTGGWRQRSRRTALPSHTPGLAPLAP